MGQKGQSKLEKLYDVDELKIRNGYGELTQLLIRRNLSITTMESATSGLIASLITDTEGSSKIFKGAYVTYSNEMKIKHGVSSEIIEKYSVYSKETALEMAHACKSVFNADIGIGITGTMGNVDPSNSDFSKLGQVFFAIEFQQHSCAFFYELPVYKNRFSYKLAVAELLLKKVLEMIK